MVAVLAIQNVARDGIIFRRKNLVDLVQSIGLDNLVRDDQVVFGAKIDAILGLLDSADAAARDAEAAH